MGDGECGSLECRAELYIVSCQAQISIPLDRVRFATHNDKHHRNPHRQSPPRLLAEHKRENTSREAPQIIHRHNDPFQPGRRVRECIEEIRIPYYPAEDALVVAKQHESKLARNGNGGAELEAAPEEVELGGFESEHCCWTFFESCMQYIHTHAREGEQNSDV